MQPIYDFHIGIQITKSELEAFSEDPNFNKVFVIKELHKGLAHYFKSKFLKGGPFNGINPHSIEQHIKSESRGPLKCTKAIEEVLIAVLFDDPKGCVNTYNRNVSRLETIL